MDFPHKGRLMHKAFPCNDVNMIMLYPIEYTQIIDLFCSVWLIWYFLACPSDWFTCIDILCGCYINDVAWSSIDEVTLKYVGKMNLYETATNIIKCGHRAYFLCVLHVNITLHWRHNDQDDVSNHHPHGCLLNRLFRRRSKKTSKLRVTGLCAGNSPGSVNSPHKGPVTRKIFPFDDIIVIFWCCVMHVL